MFAIPNPFKRTDDVVLQRKVVKEGNEWCVKSKDNSKSFGCYPTKAEAEKRLKEVEFFANK